MSEMKLVSLKCPNCSGKLDIGPSIETFACGYCGANVEVERGGNIVALRLLTDAMMGVQRGTDRTAAELAIRRLTDEVSVLQSEKGERDKAHQKIKLKWGSEVERVSSSGAVFALVIVSPLVFFMSLTLLSQISWMNSAVAGAISLSATFVVSILLWRVIRRQQRNLQAENDETREREFASTLAALNDAQQSLDIAKGRLKNQRQIVDS